MAFPASGFFILSGFSPFFFIIKENFACLFAQIDYIFILFDFLVKKDPYLSGAIVMKKSFSYPVIRQRRIVRTGC
ncbi:hypothetical protein [Leminorella grimontii]|uniref:hypothetical protein n=1 Tax=Leminorella grimontii TaxID=82981 RepID=UPI00141BB859|nr:hypothetical protein [Leminorella grimontii]